MLFCWKWVLLQNPRSMRIIEILKLHQQNTYLREKMFFSENRSNDGSPQKVVL